MTNFDLVQKIFPTLMLIIVISIAGFIKTSIKQEKIRNEQRKVLVDRVARENALLEREIFLQKHEKLVETFLEYEGQCNKIHSLLYRDPDGNTAEFTEVTKKRKCCPNAQYSYNVQPGDRAPLNYAIIYVFICILVCLLVQAIIDVSKELKSTHRESTKFSLKDYASSSCRRSSVKAVRSLSMQSSFDEGKKPDNFSPTRKRSSFNSTNTRRQSLAQYLLKGIIKLCFQTHF